MDDPLLKYANLRRDANLGQVLERERVTAVRIETNALVLGTEEGFVHVVSFSGQLIKSFRAHDRPVNDVSVDNHGLTIASCSDNGTVVVHTIGADEDKESVVHLSEPLKAVCVEDDNSSKREKSFIVGGQSGQLTHHRMAWFAQKNVILFHGADSPVSTISWRGNLVAWADATQVRILDMSTQTAVCYLDSPSGVSVDEPFPCSLFWDSDSDLFVCWADSFRHLELLTAGQHVPGNSRETIARTVTDWQADMIICGVASFDADCVLLLGYVPPAEHELERTYQWVNSSSSRGGGGGDSEGPGAVPDLEGNKAEVQVLRRSNGALVSADTLPLALDPQQGPWQLRLLSTYHCLTHQRDSQRWKVSDIVENRGGARGMCPTSFVASTRSRDVVVCSVRDVNDRVLAALQAGEVQKAVNLAYSDRSSLRHYKYSDLVTLHMDHLLEGLGSGPAAGAGAGAGAGARGVSRRRVEQATKECQRLIGGDAVLWERWIYAFARRRLLRYLAPSIPTCSPRLPPQAYAVVLESLLLSSPRVLQTVVKKWGSVSPPIFDHPSLLARIKTHRSGSAAAAAGRWLLQTEAALHVLARQYSKALGAFLQCANLPASASSSSSSSAAAKRSARGERGEREEKTTPASGLGSGSGPGPGSGMRSEGKEEDEDEDEDEEEEDACLQAFELIEAHDLFDSVRQHIPSLMTLSQELCSALLVRHIDRLPLPFVAQQLAGPSQRRLLYGYLHSVSTALPDVFNSVEYASYHEALVPLHAEFAPRSGGGTDGAEADKDGPFLRFLRASAFAPLDLALQECERCVPPRYQETVFILARTGRERQALGLLLRELRDVQAAVRFVQQHEGQPQLWSDLIDHALGDAEFLASLLDHVGDLGVSPLSVVSRIPPKASLPRLRQRLVALLAQQSAAVLLSDKCNGILAEDALGLQRALNQTQRRALKVEPSWRCVGCSRPLFLPAPPMAASNPGAGATVEAGRGLGPELPVSPDEPQIWGCGAGGSGMGRGWGGAADGGVVVFSNKIVFHRLCWNKRNQHKTQG